MHILLDIGHSRSDQGAASADGRLTEHAYWSHHATLLADRLIALGHSVTIDQRDNYGGSITRECVGINKQAPDLIVSLHLNSADNSSASGHEVIHYKGSARGKALATCINDSLSALLTNLDRGVKTPWLGRGNAFLRGTQAPAVIVEPAFVSSDDDVSLLNDQYNAIDYAIAQGIHNYTRL